MATLTEAPAEIQKRKASSITPEPEGNSKRIRIEDGADDRDDVAADDHHGDRPAPEAKSPLTDTQHRDADVGPSAGRRSNATKEDEKKRGKRLFGGLLSTLSQTNTSSQHKKRREIELRQQERAQKQRAEGEKRRAEKLAKVTEARWQEQIRFDERVMRTRHNNLLARAHHLRTKAEPQIFYRPWKLTKAQEEEIDNQISDAKDIIAREVEAFDDRKEEHARRYGLSRPTRQKPPTPAPATVESVADAPLAPEASAEATLGNTDAASQDPLDREPHDESGDVVEEAEEDMVIY